MKLQFDFFSQAPSNKVLLLIHGMGSSSSVWKPLLYNRESQDLLNAFNVLVVDLPGHGKTALDLAQEMDPVSLAKCVLETLDSLEISRFHVVGNSLGGWVGLEIAAMAPERVASVIGLAPAGLWLEPFMVRHSGTAIGRILASSLKYFSPVLLRFKWARKIGFSRVSPKWHELSLETCLEAANAMSSAKGYYPAWDAFLKKRFDKEIPLSVPLTIIFGDSDKTLPAQTCQERSLLPGHAKWLIFEECGHAPMWDIPDQVIEQIFITANVRK